MKIDFCSIERRLEKPEKIEIRAGYWYSREYKVDQRKRGERRDSR